MRYLRAVAAAILVASALCAPAAVASDDPRFDARWERLGVGGYEPLTIPVDWYDTKQTVIGAASLLVTAASDDLGVSPTALAAAATWAEAQNSTALIVARDGRIVYERFWQGTGRDTRFNPQSMSKAPVALLVKTAVRRAEIASVDVPVGPLLIPWSSERFVAEALLLLNGHGGQRVYVMPDKRLVVVRAARDGPAAWDDALLLKSVWRGTAP